MRTGLFGRVTAARSECSATRVSTRCSHTFATGKDLTCRDRSRFRPSLMARSEPLPATPVPGAASLGALIGMRASLRAGLRLRVVTRDDFQFANAWVTH